MTPELLDVTGEALQVVDTPGSAIATENIAIYKTILGLILSAIRLLEPATVTDEEMPFLIPDEDTSWMQISEADDAAGVLKKALEVLSTIAKVLENRAQEGSLATLASRQSSKAIKSANRCTGGTAGWFTG